MSENQRLRADIDAGRTRDKVAFPDPAAAPLETDAEAGGAATDPVAAAAAHAAETGREDAARQAGSALTDEYRRTIDGNLKPGPRRTVRASLTGIVVLAAAAIIVLGWVLMSQTT